MKGDAAMAEPALVLVPLGRSFFSKLGSLGLAAILRSESEAYC
jgi:hypothetical protein